MNGSGGDVDDEAVQSILTVLDGQQLSHPDEIHTVSSLASVTGVGRIHTARVLSVLNDRRMVRLVRKGVDALNACFALTADGTTAAKDLRAPLSNGPLSEYATGIDVIHSAVLNVVAEHEMREAGGSATRSQIRTSVRNLLKPTPNAESVNQAIDTLIEDRLMVLSGAEPRYRVKLLGLLTSRWGNNVVEILERVLPALREMKCRDPALYRYSWRELRKACELPWRAHNFAYLVLARTGLGPSMHIAEGDYWWVTPPDLDLLIDYVAARDFIRSLLQPTAPSALVEPRSVATATVDVAKPEPPKVFVSYSHDSDDHAQWVCRLAKDIRIAGIDATLDQWDLRLGDDLATFMERGIADSHRVLMVCSEMYTVKADRGRGGVGYEKQIVTGEMLANLRTDKFIPIIRGNPKRTMPVFAKSLVFVDFNDDVAYQAQLEKLLREIHRIPKLAKPPLGKNPFIADLNEAISFPVPTGTMERSRPIVTLQLMYKTKPESNGDVHWYELLAKLRNASERRLDDWQIEVQFPTPLLVGANDHKVEERSNSRQTLFLLDGRVEKVPLYPDQEQTFRIEYYVDTDIVWNRRELFNEAVKVRAYVDSGIVAEAERLIENLQNF
jgi:hypothetical protein